nr:MAG TPA: hypothetical protein [Caudoviricetes sp.]
MPTVSEERPSGSFFVFFAKMATKFFKSHFGNIFILSYHRLRANPLSSKTAGKTGARYFKKVSTC